jgi:hypothetical protein
VGKGGVVLICLFTAHILQETIALGFSESTSDCQSANGVIDGFYRARVIIWFVPYVAHDVSRGDAGIQMMGRARPWRACPSLWAWPSSSYHGWRFCVPGICIPASLRRQFTRTKKGPCHHEPSRYRQKLLHRGYNRFSKLRTAQQRRPFHLALEVIGHRTLLDSAVHTIDNQIGRLIPTHMAQHHFG